MFEDLIVETLPLPVTVKLIGEDGNGFVIAAKVRSAIAKAGYADESTAFFEEALAGDYNHLLNTCTKYVEVE